jgi:hypothetical protein
MKEVSDDGLDRCEVVVTLVIVFCVGMCWRVRCMIICHSDEDPHAQMIRLDCAKARVQLEQFTVEPSS